MLFVIEVPLDANAAASAVRATFEANSAALEAVGTKTVATEIQLALGAKTSIFVLHISLEFVLGVSSGVAGNAVYAALKDALTAQIHSETSAPPKAQSSPPIIRICGRDARLDAAEIGKEIDRFLLQAKAGQAKAGP